MGVKGPSKRWQLWIGALVFCSFSVFSEVQAGTSCKKGCSKSESGLLQYAPGSVYEYIFESVMTISVGSSVNGGENDDTGLKVTGNAKIFAEGNCQYTLQMGAVKVTATKEGALEKRIAEAITKPVHFNMNDGSIEPEICADSTDDIYSLNVKRAVISLLQSSRAEETKTEVDVFGQCVTHTTVSKSGSADIITKMRNLNKCAYREQLVSGILNGVVNDKAGVKGTMLLQADYAKEAKVENGVIQNVHLIENYDFAGTERTGANVKAKVTSNMKLKNVGSSSPPTATANQAVSLIFQKPDIHATKNLAALKALMSDILQVTGEYVQKESARKFVDLIRLMRNSDSDILLELGSVPFPNKVLARKIYLDCLFRTGTAESARAIIKQFSKLSAQEKVLGFLSLNLVQVVDKETIVQVAALITPTASNEIYLGVGDLVSKYCKKQNCESLPEIQGVSKKITDALKNCKANTKKEEKRILNVLKGIGNSHNLALNAAPVLSECVSPGRPLRLRVAALQALSAASCSENVRQKALQVLRDHNEDSELRIEAYLTAIECPNAELANDLADIVNNEPINQVGGFITSHLRALRDSTDIHREHQRHYLGNIRLTKKFPVDMRRYSYNNEISYRLDALGASASADYKLIYSQHGFLPRSARLNVSSEILGMNFNVFEGRVRQDNLESILEYYLGPKGLLNKGVGEIFKASNSAGSRSRRSIADESAKFAKKYKDYGSKNVDDLNLDFSLKLFGSEMLFLSFGDYIPNTLDDIVLTFSMVFDDFKKKISNFEKEFNIHSLFLDTELIYPTGLGLPLELSAQGMAANKLDLGINVDIDSIIEQNWQKSKYRLKIVPSVDVNIDFRVGFNAYVLSTGLRVSSSLHSATGADMNLAFINDNGFTLDIQLPREKLELINVKLETDIYVSEQEKQIKSIPLKITKRSRPDDSKMCFDQLNKMGFTVCLETHALTHEKSEDSQGPEKWLYQYNAGVFVTTELKYHFKGEHIPQTPAGTKIWKLAFSTPGSQESHDTSLAFELGVKPRAFGRLSLDYPQSHFALEAGLNNDDREFVLYAQYEHDNELQKNKIGFEKHGNEYKPLIAIQNRNGETVPDINGYRADGRVLVQKTDENHARYNFENFQIINNQKQLLAINGWTEVGPSALTAELRITPTQETYFVKGQFKMENGIYELGTFVNNERTPDNVIGGSINLKLADGELGATIIGKALEWELMTKNNIKYAKTESGNALNMITSSKFESELSIKNKKQIVISVSIDGYTEGQNKFGFNLKTLRGKSTGALSVIYHANQRAQNDFLVEINGKLNKHFIDVLLKCDVSGNHFVVDNSISTSWGTVLTVKGQLGKRFTPQDILIDLNGSVQLNAKDKPSQFVFKVIGAPEKTLTELTLVRDNDEIVKFNAETQHPQDKISNGKLNLIVKNIISTKADFKIAKNGKGDVNAHIETLGTEPKHKIEIDSKFHIQSPKYDTEVTIVLDNDKKIFIKTENQIEKLKFVTKNIAEIAEKKLTFDANANVKGADWRSNSEIVGSFVLNCPTGHAIDGSLKRKIATNPKTNVAQGTIELQLNEQLDGKKRSLNYNGKLEKFNRRTKDISLESQIKFIDSDNKNLDFKFHVKHLPKGKDKQKIDFSVECNGDLFGLKPTELALLVDEYDAKHAVARVNGKYGNEATVNLNGNYNVGERNDPSTFALQANIQAPNTALKAWEINANGKYQKPVNAEGVGNHQLEFHVDEKSSGKNGDQFVKLNMVYRGAQQQGSYTFDVQTERMQNPLKIEGTYQREHAAEPVGNESGKLKYSGSYSYGEKFLKSSIDITKINNDLNLHYTLESSFEAARQLNIELQAHTPDDESLISDAKMTLNGQEYALDSKFYTGVHKKGLDVKIKLPQSPKEIVAFCVFEILGERKAKLTLKLDNIADIDFNGEVEAAYKDIDEFYVTGNWNSARLKLSGYNLEFKSQNKALNINLKNSEGPIMTGNAAYVLKKERNKGIIEGQGQIQYKGQTHNTNFKLIRQVYDAATDKEIGISYIFNGNFGPKNGVSTIKITNKDFNLKLSICEEKKQCTNLQIQSQLTPTDGADSASFPIESIQHSLLILIDFRELGYPYEFELQSKTIRHGIKITYNLDSHIISNNNLKYQFIVNVQPNTSKLQLKLPSREILFESQSQQPEQGWLGKYVNSAAFYFDKSRKPNDVTRLKSTIDITGVQNGLDALNAQGEMRFEHPTIRPLVITGKADLNRQQQVANVEIVFDVFKTPEQKLIAISRIENSKREQRGFNITSMQQIQSVALGINYQLNTHTAYDIERQEFSAATDLQATNELKSNLWISFNNEHLDINFNGLNEPILNVNGEFNRKKYEGKIITKLYLFGQKPYEFISEVQPSFAKLQLKREGLTNADIELRLGKELKIHVDGAGKDLLNGQIILDGSNFLKTTYTSSEENIKQFLSHFKSQSKAETDASYEKIREHFTKLRQQMQQQVQQSKDSLPDFTQFWSGYEQNLKEIGNELETDPALKHIADSLRSIYTKLVKIATDVTKAWSEAFERLHKSFIQLNEKFQLILSETIIPAWEEFSIAATKPIGELQTEIINLSYKIFDVVMSIVEKYGPALKNYGKAIHDALKPYQEALQESYKVIVNAVEEFCDEFKKWIARLPTFDAFRAEFKDKIDKLKLAEKALEILNIIFDQLHILPAPPEMYAFFERIHKYLEATLKGQPVNDAQFVEDIVKLLLQALKPIMSNIELSLPFNAAGFSTEGVRALLFHTASSLDLLSNWPGLLNFRFSALNFIINEDWLSHINREFLNEWVYYHDFDLRGDIADGQHVFTFDGQYFSFHGNCKYILAQDSKDNNFTVVAHLNNGKLKSLILADRDGNYLELSDNGVLKSNGNPTEYPTHEESGMHAWRKYYTVWLLSEYGVQIMCTNDLKVCHIDVNGFYTSRTRGLLGNGNAEPYDDFTQVDGTIAQDSATFGNGYGLGKCNPVAPTQTSEIPHNEICTEMFSLESPLAYFYLLENVRPYRKACDQAVHEAADKDKESIACNIALAYGSSIALEYQINMLPERCLKCSGSPGQRDLYQEFTVKIPNNKADVVFVVDIGITPAVMSNLVAPAITEIRETLKARGFTDVQIGVIAYNESQRYPALLTSDNGKINYHGNLAEVQLKGPKNSCDDCLSQIVNVFNEKYVLEAYDIIEKVIKTIVPQSDELAFGMAINYPFRAGAAKTIIDVRSNNLEYGNVLKWMRAHLAEEITKFDGAIVHLIGPVKGLTLEGIPADKLIGFNSRLVATLDGKDAKKRQKLQFDTDMGIDFVLNSGGWVFGTQNFENLKPAEQKKALNQVTNSIADTLFKTEIVSDCRCLPQINGLHANHYCTVKSSNFLPNKKVKATT